ncbi:MULTISPECIES: hypothetical protein [Streptomyces]|uniref:hypothetical protein n=1 Tax=Streptomyces TaxID=1883 RepID=UPI00163C35CE|nr:MULTISPECIES: hypothetical protein [Streptomyces]MBC2878570.1 hypothetical protein [Streptomyces sp. TYQ1024]UBI35228.1 hypothetical protein K7I03_01320 [Streptomyces mobaraensis]UKW27819.1 hypothetical protein MCU78_01355 [Streptomyces sp. TYQ1024]
MGFFDGRAMPAEHEPDRPEFVDLGPAGPRYADDGPPADRYLPTVLPRVARVAEGPRVRVMFTGWEVWPEQVTLCLQIFWRRRRTDEVYGDAWFARPGAGALRVGLRPAAGGPGLTLREHGTDPGGAFHRPARFLLSAVPEGGPLVLVLEWADEGIAETAVALDTSGLGEAARRVVEIWPEGPGV